MPKPIKNLPPIVLMILDGWGLAPPNKGNAITLAKTPIMDELSKKYPKTKIYAHGKYVGLPEGQDGNSEAGHMNLGAGRIVAQDSVGISQAINTGVFFKNPAFLTCLDHVKKNNSSLHLMGLLSEEQSAHVDPQHLLALLSLYRQKKVKKIFLHLFTDGRDSSKFIAVKLVEKLEKFLRPNEQIASITGRFYAMDRKKNWKNIEKTYDALVMGKAPLFTSPKEAILSAYNKGESDEFAAPSIIVHDIDCKKSASKKNAAQKH
ncbi:hypothetical protein HQ544_01535 [Candidatus Falkowbacteria bacterium]|nr:hypothetical protein [Candidatus Falkowbacteria bacterium]